MSCTVFKPKKKIYWKRKYQKRKAFNNCNSPFFFHPPTVATKVVSTLSWIQNFYLQTKCLQMLIKTSVDQTRAMHMHWELLMYKIRNIWKTHADVLTQHSAPRQGAFVLQRCDYTHSHVQKVKLSSKSGTSEVSRRSYKWFEAHPPLLGLRPFTVLSVFTLLWNDIRTVCFH